MALRNGQPIVWRARGLSDSIDGTNSFPGAMASLSNLLPDPTTDDVWVARPPAASATTFGSFTTPGFVSALLVIGVRAYGMIASGRNSGHDEPFCYDLLAGSFVTISGITSGNTPTSPATTGAWTPPIMCQVGSRIIVTHPGFNSTTKFGWFDISGFSQGILGDTVNTSPVITGNPTILGVQPGLAITGTGIPGSTTVLFAAAASSAHAVTGNSHTNFTIDSIASTAGIFAGMAIVGPGIPPGTTVTVVAPTALTLSQAAQSSLTGAQFVALLSSPSPAGFFTGGFTAGSATVTVSDTSNLWVGQAITAGVVVPTGATIVSLVANTSITLSQNATVTGSFPFQAIGNVIVMSANATSTNNNDSIQITGGTFAAPQWGAGDTQPNNLPQQPVGVAQMNGRAWYACGTSGIPFSDSGFPCQISDNIFVQALTTNDGLAVTAIGPVYLSSLVGGQVQSLIAFEASYKMQQITGDPDKNNLAMNALPVATGTLAPLSLTPCELGLAFISPEGMRVVDFIGRISPPYGDHGQGITTPFIYATTPSRICGAANSDTLRWTVQNGYKTGSPQEDYWYDIGRKAWHGPHTSTASLLAPYGADSFALTFIGTNANLFTQSTIPVTTSTYVENGKQMVGQFMPVYLMPDNAAGVMNMIRDMTLACGGPNCDPTAPPEPLLYPPPVIGGVPVQPGTTVGTGTVLPPNQPPPPPGQPPSFCIYGNPTNLPFISGGVPTIGIGFDISDDGTIIVGECDGGADGNTHAVYWTNGGTPTQLPMYSSGTAAVANCCSSDGLTIFGFADDSGGTQHAAKWHGGVVSVLPMLSSGDSGQVHDCSHDGSFQVGSANASMGGNINPVYWNGGSPVALPTLASQTAGDALGCDATGKTIVGRVVIGGIYHAVKWTATSAGGSYTATDLGGLGHTGLTMIAEAFDCSADGTIVVGEACSVAGSLQHHAVYWDASNTIHDIEGYAGGTFSNANAISNDGTIIVGQEQDHAGLSHAAFWTVGGSMTPLISPTGGTVTDVEAYCVSADKKSAAGGVNYSDAANQAEAWCLSDY